MAKTNYNRRAVRKASAPAPQPRVARARVPAEVKEPTQKTLRLIDTIRPQFMAFVSDFAIITASREQLAPAFMKAFGAYQVETAGSFVSFVRLLDPTVPADAAGYRANSTYSAADYLRRKAAQQATPRVRVPLSQRPATPLVALARLVATILPMLDEKDALWASFVQEMHWSDSQVARLQTIVNREGPVAVHPSRRSHDAATPALPTTRLSLRQSA